MTLNFTGNLSRKDFWNSLLKVLKKHAILRVLNKSETLGISHNISSSFLCSYYLLAFEGKTLLTVFIHMILHALSLMWSLYHCNNNIVWISLLSKFVFHPPHIIYYRNSTARATHYAVVVHHHLLLIHSFEKSGKRYTLAHSCWLTSIL